MKNIFRLIGILMIVSGCQSIHPKVAIHDIRVCGDLGEFGAHCAHTLTPQTEDIQAPDWANLRVGWLCMDSSDFTATETSQAELCNEFQVCDYQTQEKIMTVVRRLHSVALKAQRARRHHLELMSEAQ